MRESDFVENFDSKENKIENYKKAVVLIRNQYYYVAQFSNGQELFFYLDKVGNVIPYNSKEEANRNPRIAYGTGFLISEQGKIATNRHVINPIQVDSQLLKSLHQIYDQKNLSINSQLDSIDNHISRIELLLNIKSNKPFVSTQKESLDNQLADLKSNKQYLISASNKNYNPLLTNVSTKRIKLEVVLHQENNDNLNFINCEVLNESSDYDLDLAIIAIKNQNAEVYTNYIQLHNTKSYIEYNINDEVFMIGFNLQLPNSESPKYLQPKVRNGKIEKIPSSKRIQYSIISFPGSSGSPILDKSGNLVAVNFAKTSDNIDLSFGIPAQYLTALESNTNLTAFRDTTIQRSKEEYTLKPVEENLSKAIIKSYFQAEDKRDIQTIMNFYTPRPSQYYDLKFPNHKSIKGNILKAWESTKTSKNTIKTIQEIDSKYFRVELEFEYENNSGKKNKSSSIVIMKLNETMQITDIYTL